MEKLKSHSSWNCHLIYFTTWYRLFFCLFFALLCSLVPFARLHIVSHLMSNSRFKHTIASTQPQRERVENHEYTRTGEHNSCSWRNEEKKEVLQRVKEEYFGRTRTLSLAFSHSIRVYTEDTRRKSLYTRSNKFFDILMQSLSLPFPLLRAASLLCCVKFCVQLMVF